MLSSNKNSRTRYRELDALRGIAALAVLLYHYTTRYNELFIHKTQMFFEVSYGYLGVQLFFVISGFVIFLTVENAKTSTEFVLKRFSRLYPVYWVSIIITFVVVSVWGLEGRGVSLLDAGLNFLMFHGYFLVPNVDNVYWTLKVELTFYFWMFLLLITKKHNSIELISLVWIVLAFLYNFLSFPFAGYLKSVLLFDYGYLFIAGMIFYRIQKYGDSWFRYFILGLSFSFHIWITSSLISIFIIGGVFGIFYLFIKDKLKYIAIAPLVYLGGISYPLYLVHQNIGYVIINNNYSLGSNNYFLIILIPLISSILIADLLHRIVEIPCQKYLRNMLLGTRGK